MIAPYDPEWRVFEVLDKHWPGERSDERRDAIEQAIRELSERRLLACNVDIPWGFG